MSTESKNKKINAVFSFVILHRCVCVLEVMLNPFSMDNVVGTQDSESENELVSISGQLPSDLAAQIPSVVVENSSDIHIGPRIQYNAPVTIKQYITVKGKNGVDPVAETSSENTDTTTQHPPEGAKPVGTCTQVICMLA